jgi:hypothetical protein
VLERVTKARSLLGGSEEETGLLHWLLNGGSYQAEGNAIGHRRGGRGCRARQCRGGSCGSDSGIGHGRMSATVEELPISGREGTSSAWRWDLWKMPRPLAQGSKAENFRGDIGGARAAAPVA